MLYDIKFNTTLKHTNVAFNMFFLKFSHTNKEYLDCIVSSRKGVCFRAQMFQKTK